ncbi:unnamed protein product [Zymoseptoria tritici ST99CH_3D7]|uniref:SGNH hydrolase-type esterase domain-containing protein n=1 Tax=Zymoseptoria tritici (strain ST99CH_3D7) TaxID=1276538 RepID=A0A1X7RC44_ZYMT9|nr:unnamed protein product [Zymoseptoria tritici ST99CH_3D7]
MSIFASLLRVRWLLAAAVISLVVISLGRNNDVRNRMAQVSMPFKGKGDWSEWRPEFIDEFLPEGKGEAKTEGKDEGGEEVVNGDSTPETKGDSIPETKGDDTPASAKSDSEQPGSHSVINVPLRILPVGDSITEGKERNGNNGWRLPLRNHLVQEGRSVDFIGTKETGDNNPDNQHEGWGGQAMVVIQEKIMANNILTQHPNLVLLGAGTNDCNEGFGLPPTEPHESEIIRLENLMDAILCENPGAALIVAQITDNLTDLKDTERVRKFNSQIPGLVEKKRKQGFRVGIVDMFNAVGYNLDDSGIHPSEKGYNAMAAAWFEAIKLLPEEWIQPAREPGSKAPAFWSQQETLACGALKGWDRDYFVTNKSQSAWMYPPKEDMSNWTRLHEL